MSIHYSHEKQSQTHQHIITAKVTFKAISSLLCTILQIFNSPQGAMPCTATVFFGRLFDMCKNRSVRRDCAFKCHRRRSLSMVPHVHACQWILGSDKNRQARLHAEAMSTMCWTGQCARMRRHGMLRDPVDVAIDKHAGVQIRQVREDRKHDNLKVQERNMPL